MIRGRGLVAREVLGHDTGYVQTAGRWAYVGSGNSTRFAVVDIRSGRVVGRGRTAKPTTIFVP